MLLTMAGAHPLLMQAKHTRLSRSPPRLPPEPQDGNTEYKLKLINISSDRFEHLITQMKWRLAEGGGECIYQIGVADDGAVLGLSQEELTASLQTLAEMAEAVNAHITTLQTRPSFDGKGIISEVHLRCVPEEQQFLDVRVLFVGDCGVGKSTLIGVMTTGSLETESGVARLNLFKHNHEMLTGRTATLNAAVLGFNDRGAVVNHSEDGKVATLAQVCDAASKLIHMYDSPGHAKFHRTTLRALAGPDVDYLVLVLAGNLGLSSQAKEYLDFAAAVHRNVIVLITKIDICSKPVLRQTLSDVMSAIKSPPCKRVPFIVKNDADLMTTAHDFVDSNVVPIFMTSAVSGHKLSLFTQLLNMLPAGQQTNLDALALEPVCYRVENVFELPEVGTVIGGRLAKGQVRVGDTLAIGPLADGDFDTVVIKDIHRNRTPVRVAKAGQIVTFAIDYGEARRGMCLCPEEALPSVCWRFDAEVLLLREGQLEDGMQVCAYVNNVRQHAVVHFEAAVEQQRAAGSVFPVTFALQSRPEVIEIGARLVFRNDRVKGIGKVIKVVPLAMGSTEEPDEAPGLDI